MPARTLPELLEEFKRLATNGVPPEDASRAYTWSPWVYACVRRLVDAAANIPLIVVQGDTDNRENGRYQSLLDRPNELVPSRAFRDQLYSWLFLEGRAPVLIDDGSGFASSGALRTPLARNDSAFGLVVLNPNRLRPAHGEVEPFVSMWDYQPTENMASRMEIHDSRLMRVETFGTGDRPVGAGTVLESFALPFGKWATMWNAEGFRSGGAHRRYAISTKRRMDNDSLIDKFLDRWRRKFAGRSNRDPVVMGSEATINTIGDSHSDMGYEELYNLYIMEVAAAFGAPPSILGILKHANYNSLSVQERLFYEVAILPATRLVCDAFNFRVTPRFKSGLRVKCDISEVKALQENMNDWVNWTERERRVGNITANEARRTLIARGWKEIDGDHPDGDSLTPSPAIAAEIFTEGQEDTTEPEPTNEPNGPNGPAEEEPDEQAASRNGAVRAAHVRR